MAIPPIGRPVRTSKVHAKASIPAPRGPGPVVPLGPSPGSLVPLEGTAPAAERSRLEQGLHPSPHDLLGAHSVQVDGHPALAVRAWMPGQAEVRLVKVSPVGVEPRLQRIPMRPLGGQGLYEAVLPPQKGLRYYYEVQAPDGFVTKVEDPYRFLPTTSDLQLWLHAEGKLDDVSKLLGAHERTLSGVSGYAFTLWAPNAQAVRVVSEQNGFDGRAHPMRQLGDSGIWELFVPGVVSGQRYQFEVLGQDGQVIRKADPCARQTALRPSLDSITAPESKHAWKDGAWMKARATADHANAPVSVYELHLASWQRGPAGEMLGYRQLAEKLIPHLEKTGFTHVELVGLAEHPFDGSWGYQVTGYYAPTARHGSPEDFKAFVDRLHQAGIGVLYDWVPAHFPKDAAGLASFDGTHLYDHADARQGEHKDWGTRCYNYGRKEVAGFLAGGLMHMLDEFHLDGARVDAVASMLYLDYSRQEGEWIPNVHGGRENLEAIDFLKHVNERVKARFPGAMRVAEESTAFPGVTKPAAEGGLGFDTKWNMGWMNDTLEWFKIPPEHRGAALDRLTNTFLWAHSERYVCALSHDEVVHGKGSLLNKMPGDDWQKFANLRLLYGFMWSYPGHKLLTMGGELAQRSEWNHDGSVEWDSLKHPPHQGVQTLVGDLNRLYRESPALHRGQFQPEAIEVVSRDHQNGVLAMSRRGAEERLLFVHNLTPAVQHDYRIGVDEPGLYQERLNTDDLRYGGSGVRNEAREAEAIPSHGKPYSVRLTLPPLATVAIERRRP